MGGVDITTCSDKVLRELFELYKDPPPSEEQITLRAEMIRRAKNRGLTNRQVIDRLVAGVPKGRKRDDIAKDWAIAFGLSVEEFKRIADS